VRERFKPGSRWSNTQCAATIRPPAQRGVSLNNRPTATTCPCTSGPLKTTCCQDILDQRNNARVVKAVTASNPHLPLGGAPSPFPLLIFAVTSKAVGATVSNLKMSAMSQTKLCGLPPCRKRLLCDPNRAFALDEAGHRVFRWDCDQHMDMIGHQMAFLDPAFPPPGQAVKYGSEVLLDFSEDRFLTVLRYDICNPMWHGSGDAAAS